MSKKGLTPEEIAEKEKAAREAERKEKEATEKARKESVKKIREQAKDKKTIEAQDVNGYIVHILSHFFGTEVDGEIATNIDDLIIYYDQKKVQA